MCLVCEAHPISILLQEVLRVDVEGDPGRGPSGLPCLSIFVDLSEWSEINTLDEQREDIAVWLNMYTIDLGGE